MDQTPGIISRELKNKQGFERKKKKNIGSFINLRMKLRTLYMLDNTDFLLHTDFFSLRSELNPDFP
jgi:hypothetical protein